ncbi:MAG TPA: thioesterase family protein [Roseiflexaceae bacterium]|nr:thioesterase family protein [Roseiflexaceae bacterium]
MAENVQPYPYTITVEVSFRDLDALGHVNNAVYLTYIETARIKYLVDLLDLKALGELPVILAEASCTYKSPAFFGERLSVGVGISRFGAKSFDMAYRIAGGDGRLVALARTVQVMYDYAAARTIAVPEAFKSKVHAFQDDWQAP